MALQILSIIGLGLSLTFGAFNVARLFAAVKLLQRSNLPSSDLLARIIAFRKVISEIHKAKSFDAVHRNKVLPINDEDDRDFNENDIREIEEEELREKMMDDLAMEHWQDAVNGIGAPAVHSEATSEQISQKMMAKKKRKSRTGFFFLITLT